MIDADILNWEELARKYSIEADGPEDFMIKFVDLKHLDRLDELDGSYSIAIEKEGTMILARDKIGIRPVFYKLKDGLKYSFDKRVLDGIELNPRKILLYREKPEFIDRDFFKVIPEIKESRQEIVSRLRDLLLESIVKRVPKDGSPVGVLFSGGVDSTFLAYSLKMLKEQGRIKNDLVCYTSGFVSEGQDEAKDLVASTKIAKEYGFDLQTNVIGIDEVEKMIKKVISIISDTNVIKVGVGVTGLAAGTIITGTKVVFTGLGSEEIFAGYERHRKAEDVNKECLTGLEMIYERDCYRDMMICKEAGLELRLPFLDNDVVEYALRIPAKFKLDIQNKMILRDVAKSIGIHEKFAERKKLGAQYGSKFDKALSMLAKRNGFKYKSDYLKSLDETREDL